VRGFEAPRLHHDIWMETRLAAHLGYHEWSLLLTCMSVPAATDVRWKSALLRCHEMGAWAVGHCEMRPPRGDGPNFPNPSARHNIRYVTSLIPSQRPVLSSSALHVGRVCFLFEASAVCRSYRTFPPSASIEHIKGQYIGQLSDTQQ
jgi:hypothetical protein